MIPKSVPLPTCICMIEPLSVCAGVSVYSSLLSTVKVPVLQCMPVWRQKKKKQTGSAALPCHTELTPIVVWTLLELRKETRVTAAGHTHTHTLWSYALNHMRWHLQRDVKTTHTISKYKKDYKKYRFQIKLYSLSYCFDYAIKSCTSIQV